MASIRKEILRSLDVVNVKDVVKRHLNDFETSIVELHSFGKSSSDLSNTSSPGRPILSSTVVDLTYEEVVDNCNDSSDSELNKTYESDSEEYGSCQTPLYTDAFGDKDIDERMVTISRTGNKKLVFWVNSSTDLRLCFIAEYLRLRESDKKCLELEETVHKLEEELKKVYVNTLNVMTDKKEVEKEVQTLRSELNRMANMIKYVEDKEDELENRFYGIKQNTNATKKTVDDQPMMIAIKKVATRLQDVKQEPQTDSQTSIRNIYHNHKGVPKVD